MRARILILGLAAIVLPTLVIAAPKAQPLPKILIAKDGHSFVTEQGKPFVPFGLNYFRPGTGWAPQVWKKFDAEATRKDFARMKELGVNCVRVFLSYGSFLVETNRLSPEGLAKFDQFLEIAEQAGIYVHPTGPDHWEGHPAWAATDRYADEGALGAVEFFWREFAARYRGRSVIFACDLLNEPVVAWDTPPMRKKWNRWLEKKYGSVDKLAQAWGTINQNLSFGSISVPPKEDCARCARLLDFQHFREEIADDWTCRQVTAIKAFDPRALVTVGLIQYSVPSPIGAVWQYSAFRPEYIARFLDFMEIHFYPLANGVYQYASGDEARNLAYLESVVREVARCGKPVVIAEFGWYGGGQLTFGKYVAATEKQQARWCKSLVNSTAGLACGWLNWGFHDHPGARDVTELTGLLTADGKTKAWGRTFQKLARRYRAAKLTAPRLGPRPDLDWDLCITSAAEGAKYRQRYFEALKATQPRTTPMSR
jgi:endo-1,4-beta-mannosidase